MNETTCNDGLLAVTWQKWLLWVGVCSAEPVFYEISKIPFYARSPAFLRDISAPIVLVIALAAALAPLLLQGLVIRQLAPSLTLRHWCLAVLAAVGVWLAWQFSPNALSRPDSYFAIGVWSQLAQGNNRLADYLTLPWWRLVMPTILISGTVAFVPALVLQNASKVVWYKFLLAALAAACASTILKQFGPWLTLASWNVSRPLENLSWPERFRYLSLLMELGAIWGATSLATLVYMEPGSVQRVAAHQRSIAPTRTALLMTIPVIAAIVPLGQYLLGETGIRAGLPAVFKALTLSPSADESTGDAILMYSETAKLGIARHPPGAVVSFAPDSKSFILLAEDRAPHRIDTKSGSDLGSISEPLRPFEVAAFTWSPDGRYLLLLTDGAQIKIPDSNYFDNRNRFRLYELPSYRLVRDFSYDAKICISHSHTQSLFEEDSNSIWMRCDIGKQPTADDLIAIRVSVPSMDVIQEVHYGDDASAGTGLDLFRVRGHVWVAQRENLPNTETNFHDLTTGQFRILTIQPLNLPEYAGTSGFQWLAFDAGELAFSFCGNSIQVSNPSEPDKHPDQVHSFCRQLYFNDKNGNYIRRVDQANLNALEGTFSLEDKRRGIRIEGPWSSSSSKANDITVRDARSNALRQRIHSVAQRPLTLSPDGRWLLTHAYDRGTVRIYKILL